MATRTPPLPSTATPSASRSATTSETARCAGSCWPPKTSTEFERLQSSDAEVVQEPTEQPYGFRDCAFRDAAGNMVRIQELS